jgi:hypothetical protein
MQGWVEVVAFQHPDRAALKQRRTTGRVACTTCIEVGGVPGQGELLFDV